MTGPEYIQEAIKNHGFVPDDREIANKPFAEFEGLTQNEYEAMRLVSYFAYQAPKWPVRHGHPFFQDHGEIKGDGIELFAYSKSLPSKISPDDYKIYNHMLYALSCLPDSPKKKKFNLWRWLKSLFIR